MREVDVDYWRTFIARRGRFIESILGRRDQLQCDAVKRAQVEAALEAARDQLKRISPEFCDRVIRAWIAVRALWQRHLATLPRGVPLPEALRVLGVTQPLVKPPRRRTGTVAL